MLSNYVAYKNLEEILISVLSILSPRDIVYLKVSYYIPAY